MASKGFQLFWRWKSSGRRIRLGYECAGNLSSVDFIMSIVSTAGRMTLEGRREFRGAQHRFLHCCARNQAQR